MKKISLLIIIILLAIGTTTSLAYATATDDQHCPDHNGNPGKFEGQGSGEKFGVEITVSGASVTFSKDVEFCVKAGTGASGKQDGDSFTVNWLNNGGQTPNISYVIIYEVKQDDPPPDPPPTASASVSVNVCGVGDFSTKVDISFTGVTSADITGPQNQSLSSPSILNDWPFGVYNIHFNVDTANYQDPGNLDTSFEILLCDEKKDEETDATASVTVGVCGVGDTSTKVTIAFTGVTSADITGPHSETIYSPSDLLSWPIGVYNIHFNVDTENYNDPGGLDTSFEILVCDEEKEDEEKEEEKEGESSTPSVAPSVSAKPDVAAGGSGPSLISMLTPVMIGLSEAALVGSLIKGRIIKRK